LKSAKERTNLLGIRISVGLLIALGCLWGFFALFFVGIFGMSGVRSWKDHLFTPDNLRWFAILLLAIAVTTALAWLCFRAAAALRNTRQWAAYVAMAFGMLLLLFTVSFIYDLYHPERQSPDEYFVILFAPFSLLVGLWFCIYLNLPHVRTHLKNSPSK
jgi:magnesium-transporting ATPase (P-type)